MSIARECVACDAIIPKGKLRCPSCNRWQTERYETVDPTDDGSSLLSEVESSDYDRISVGFADPIFGGGIVRGGATLIGGNPGSGKSTICLQWVNAICERENRVALYVSAEERGFDVSLRAKRLRLSHINQIRIIDIRSGFEGTIDGVIEARNPCALIVDSIPALSGRDQERAVDIAAHYKRVAVNRNIPALIIDHVTKDGDLAGLMALQHEVDTTLTLVQRRKGDISRLLSVLKNRYGPNAEQCLTMHSDGLRQCRGCTYCSSAPAVRLESH